MFIDDMMIEYSYPECTVSVITALVEFQRRYSYRSADIELVNQFIILPQLVD